MAAAAALGVLAGVCTGYVVQAQRPPTPLPALGQKSLEQASGPAPNHRSSAGDRQARTEGDLRQLLVRKPNGATPLPWLPDTAQWLSLEDYASQFDDAGSALTEQTDAEFRRAAQIGWHQTGLGDVQIALVQYRQERTTAAAEFVDQASRETTDSRPTGQAAVPGAHDGGAYVFGPGDSPSSSGYAVAWRGDVLLQIWVDGDDKKIPVKALADLAGRQWERL
ncbi:hypothetical protein ACFV3R_22780 [Streptomyces sp. NPDC059740]|uniref:hypothetical protein n=1 Tax=Streptomyces sp. NPDC059740 TaxID=3346926 RepID=UPI0036503CFA